MCARSVPIADLTVAMSEAAPSQRFLSPKRARHTNSNLIFRVAHMISVLVIALFMLVFHHVEARAVPNCDALLRAQDETISELDKAKAIWFAIPTDDVATDDVCTKAYVTALTEVFKLNDSLSDVQKQLFTAKCTKDESYKATESRGLLAKRQLQKCARLDELALIGAEGEDSASELVLHCDVSFEDSGKKYAVSTIFIDKSKSRFREEFKVTGKEPDKEYWNEWNDIRIDGNKIVGRGKEFDLSAKTGRWEIMGVVAIYECK